MLYSGIRISEALGLTWDDINMEEKTININHQMLCRNLNGKLVQYCEDNTKTSNGSRIIPMNDFAYKSVIEQKRTGYHVKKIQILI